jgi:galactosylceramide sulfotransferase/galactose-3-O-sulfotransferase 3
MFHNLSFVLPPKGHIYIGWPYRVDKTLYRPKKSKDFNILCEHAIYDEVLMKELMPANTVYITSLREPFSQFKSMLNYYNVFNISRIPPPSENNKQSLLSVFLTNIETYDATYKSKNASKTRYCIPDGFSMTKNLMAYNLGFSTGFLDNTQDMSSNDEFIQQWLTALSSKFKFVLLTEWFYESMILLRREMCWTLTDILFRATNSLRYNYKTDVDDHLVQLYKVWSRVDYVLYSHFNESFHKNLARQDIGFWKEVDNYRTVNRMVNNHCTSISNSRKDVANTFVVNETPWNEKFSIDESFCGLLLNEDSLPMLQKLYELQPPQVTEVPPSIKTC